MRARRPPGGKAVDIKQAFRWFARKYHPVVSKAPDTAGRTQERNEGFAVLSDPEQHTAYAQRGKGYHADQEFRPPPDWNTGCAFSGRDLSRAEVTD